MARIYEHFRYFGEANVGVAIIDNGLFPEWEDYIAQGKGTFEARAYYAPFSTTDRIPDGTQPQPSDVYGILESIGPMYAHGTRQIE